MFVITIILLPEDD